LHRHYPIHPVLQPEPFTGRSLSWLGHLDASRIGGAQTGAVAMSQVGKRRRHLLVFAHVVVSLGWMGAGLANVVLAMTGGYTSDADFRRVAIR